MSTEDKIGAEIYRLEQAAQRDAERRLGALMELVYEDAEYDDPRWDGIEQAGPFCGCDTCQIRETLSAAWPHLLEAARILIREGME
jgi:hypothetical protein